jgi:hypothetical protein
MSVGQRFVERALEAPELDKRFPGKKRDKEDGWVECRHVGCMIHRQYGRVEMGGTWIF